MVKIALIGAPGAGKSKLASALRKELGKDDWGVVDTYIQKLQKQTGSAYGPVTSFAAEIEVLGARWVAEDALVNQGKNVITCGTIYESLIHASSIQPWAQYEQTMIQDQIYISTMMSAFGALAVKTFDYHALFYLPWEGREHDHSWDAVVNAKLPEVLDGFGLAYVTVEGTTKQRVERVTELITALVPQPTEDEQQAV